MLEFQDDYGTHRIENPGTLVFLVLLILIVMVGIALGLGWVATKV